MPIGVVPKPHSTNIHLVTDHSAGEHALNSFIAHSNSTIKLDSLQDFGSILHAILSQHRHPPAWLPLLTGIPIHPLWQMKQINMFEGLHHVGCNVAFGTCTAPRIWCTFFGLVMWITI